MEKGTITEWHKSEGDAVKNGEVLCEVETDKAVMDYEADFDAVLLKIVISDGQSAAVGETIAVYGEEGEDVEDLVPGDITEVEPTPSASPAAQETLPPGQKTVPQVKPESPAESGRRIKSSPLARKMAADLGIDLSVVHGSGYDGRIIKQDILKVSESAAPMVRTQAPVKPVSGMRKAIAQRLTASKFTAPHYYLTISVNMSSLIEAREEYKKRSGMKLSYNSYFIKFCSAALKNHPIVNASWTDTGIRKFESADIGFAVALDDGLIAPVIRKCETLGIKDIDDIFKNLSGRAKTNELKPDEYSNAGFSISNLGSFGIEEFTAIINPPGSAILALGTIIKTPIVVDDGADIIRVEPVMKMTLSCDHRVIDGATGAAFLADLKRMMENPIEAMM